MRTSFVGKYGAMASRYDGDTKAKAVRLVREHRDDYDAPSIPWITVSRRRRPGRPSS